MGLRSTTVALAVCGIKIINKKSSPPEKKGTLNQDRKPGDWQYYQLFDWLNREKPTFMQAEFFLRTGIKQEVLPEAREPGSLCLLQVLPIVQCLHQGHPGKPEIQFRLQSGLLKV